MYRDCTQSDCRRASSVMGDTDRAENRRVTLWVLLRTSGPDDAMKAKILFTFTLPTYLKPNNWDSGTQFPEWFYDPYALKAHIGYVQSSWKLRVFLQETLFSALLNRVYEVSVRIAGFFFF